MSNYFKNIYDGVATAAVGMNITLKHLFGKKVTMQYPEIYHPIHSGDMPKNSRNRIFVDMDGCDGCDGCARACPVNCITVETSKVTPGDNAPDLNNGKKRKTWVLKHEIDFAKCCFCSLCTEACPTNAIYMTQEFEYSSYDKNDLIYNFAPFTEEEANALKQKYVDYQEQQKREKAEKKKAEAEAKKKEMEAKKADSSESGDSAGAGEKSEKDIEREKKRAEAEARKKERLAKKAAEENISEAGNTEKSEKDIEREKKRAEAEARKQERLAKKAAEAEKNSDGTEENNKEKD
jgi:formate hydrogenlyase subunit 6/NADH:ubiquinone oxidoreductase subunit I